MLTQRSATEKFEPSAKNMHEANNTQNSIDMKKRIDSAGMDSSRQWITMAATLLYLPILKMRKTRARRSTRS